MIDDFSPVAGFLDIECVQPPSGRVEGPERQSVRAHIHDLERLGVPNAYVGLFCGLRVERVHFGTGDRDDIDRPFRELAQPSVVGDCGELDGANLSAAEAVYRFGAGNLIVERSRVSNGPRSMWTKHWPGEGGAPHLVAISTPAVLYSLSQEALERTFFEMIARPMSAAPPRASPHGG
ncbi:hypothetical protein EGY25_00645 [Brevundimonas intermedia]|uniref:Uncharacterized protein n=1 Tax=Brevundimonas intermedia TaxID=74315 RepID=A0A4Y9S5K4_9CAUL|nr:hypothetical protein EGY25_00645 [Brevundimonas intermedia]